MAATTTPRLHATLRNRMARDSFSYLHFPMIAGITRRFGLAVLLVGLVAYETHSYREARARLRHGLTRNPAAH